MKHSRKLIYCINLLILTIIIGGCGILNKEESKEEQIKKSFDKTLGMYPIKNLEDLYDKEGYRDEEFDKDDKGTWILHSEMAIQSEGEDLEVRGMVIKLNRNTKTAKGKYITNRITEDSKGRPQNNQKQYPITMENNKIIPTEKIEDKKIKEEIEDFKFFAQYGNFKDLKKYKDGDISTNPNVPSYSAKYQLKNNDYNVEQIRKRYDIPTKQAPKLLLKGTGDIKGSSVGYQNLEFTFVENQRENIFFTDSIEFNISEDY